MGRDRVEWRSTCKVLEDEAAQARAPGRGRKGKKRRPQITLKEVLCAGWETEEFGYFAGAPAGAEGTDDEAAVQQQHSVDVGEQPQPTAQPGDCPKGAPSDNSEDSYSLLDAPRASTQARMLGAMREGRLEQLVLGEEGVELGAALAKCLEVLGISSKPEADQRAAAAALVALCTHRSLRPAVDHLVVLRRLGRIIELTDSPAALEAALDVLVELADDAGWEDKDTDHAVVGALRDGVVRCLHVVSAAGTSKRAPDLAAQALPALKEVRLLKLLSEKQLVEAAGAVSNLMRLPEVREAALGVLQTLLEPFTWAHLAHGSSCRAHVGAAVFQAGALEPLLQLLEAHLPAGCESSSSDDLDDTIFDVLRCLHGAVAACELDGGAADRNELLQEAVGAAGKQRTALLLMRLLHALPSCSYGADMALHVLVVLCLPEDADMGSTLAAGLALQSVDEDDSSSDGREDFGSRILRAAKGLLEDADAGLTPSTATRLLQFLSALCGFGPAEFSVGAAGRSLLRSLVQLMTLCSSPGADVNLRALSLLHHHADVEQAALELVARMCEAARGQPSALSAQDASSLALALVHKLVLGTAAELTAAVSTRLRCFALCMERAGVAEPLAVAIARHTVVRSTQKSGSTSSEGFVTAFANQLVHLVRAGGADPCVVLRAAAALLAAVAPSRLTASVEQRGRYMTQSPALDEQLALYELTCAAVAACGSCEQLDVVLAVLQAVQACTSRPGCLLVPGGASGYGPCALVNYSRHYRTMSGSRQYITTYGSSDVPGGRELVKALAAAQQRLLALAAAAASKAGCDSPERQRLVRSALEVAAATGKVLGAALKTCSDY